MPHEIDLHVAFHGAHEVGGKEDGAFEDADDVKIAGGVILRNLLAELANALLNLFGGDEDFELGIDHEFNR